MGLENYRLDRTFIPRNHYTLPAHHDFLVEKYAEEIKLGRLSIGYDPALLESWIGHFRTAPLSVAETRPGKLRAIVDQSFPHSATPIDLDTIHSDTLHPILINPESTSINAIIDSKKFQCAWGTFSECYLKVANAPSGTQAAVFDVESAFRNVPTHPSVRPFTAISLNGLVHLDPCLNFGASPSPGIWGRIADAMVRILLNEGVEALVKWVDDFVFFRFPKTSKEGSIAYSYEADLIWSIADKLGWPWARSKFIPFNTAFPYIGFWWDIEAKFVSLPQAKKEKYLTKLMPWEAGVKMTKGEAESVIGTLNHVCLVVPDGRSHMPTLYRFRASFKENDPAFIQHTISSTLAEDLAWWKHKLSLDLLGIPIITPAEPLDVSLMVDASTSWGLGLVLDGKWLAWELIQGWKSDGRDIGWAEMVVIELGLRTLIAKGLKDCHIVIRSDNQGVVGALLAGYSRNTQQNAILRRIVFLMQESGIWLSTVWISTKDNLADDPSRGVLGHKKDLLPFPPKIPSHLKPYVKHSIDYNDPRIK